MSVQQTKRQRGSDLVATASHHACGFDSPSNSSLQPNGTAAPAWWVLQYRVRFRRLSSGPLGGERFRMKRFTIAVFFVLACAPDVSFPTQPPASSSVGPRFGVTPAQLRSLSERGAIDCGAAADPRSADSVYQCATQALSHRQPFFCRYALPRSDVSDLSPTRLGGVWAWPTAYVGTSGARVFRVVEKSPGRFVIGHPVLDDAGAKKPRRIHTGMTPPRPVSR